VRRNNDGSRLIEEDHGEVSLTIWKSGRFLSARRWSGIASADWGTVSGSKRTRRSLRNSLVPGLRSRRGAYHGYGSDHDEFFTKLKSDSQNFDGLDLAEIDLSGRSLSGFSFVGVNFSLANLQGADLSRSDLSGAWLDQTDLEGADLSYAKLSGAVFITANIRSARMRGADLSSTGFEMPEKHFVPIEYYAGGTYLHGSDLTLVDLEEADLSGAILRHCDLSDSVMRGATLVGAELSDCSLVRADLSYSKFG